MARVCIPGRDGKRCLASAKRPDLQERQRAPLPDKNHRRLRLPDPRRDGDGMTSAPTPSALPPSPVEDWHAILKSTVLRVPALPEDLFKRMRRAKLTFGDRVPCPFLRPFF